MIDCTINIKEKYNTNTGAVITLGNTWQILGGRNLV